MSGDSYYFGDNVNMNNAQNSIGINKGGTTAPANIAATDPALLAAIQELNQLVGELRGKVPAASAAVIDDSLPSVRADGAVAPKERHRALLLISGIAGTIGAVGQPVAEAVNKILQLLGAL